MFILFDAKCQNCNRPFKVEAERGSDCAQYRCACPRCHATVSVFGEHGKVSATATGWAVRATAVAAIPA